MTLLKLVEVGFRANANCWGLLGLLYLHYTAVGPDGPQLTSSPQLPCLVHDFLIPSRQVLLNIYILRRAFRQRGASGWLGLPQLPPAKPDGFTFQIGHELNDDGSRGRALLSRDHWFRCADAVSPVNVRALQLNVGHLPKVESQLHSVLVQIFWDSGEVQAVLMGILL